MKKKFVVMMLILPICCLAAQKPKNGVTEPESVNRFGIYGGMGVHGTDAPSIVDHLNTAYGSSLLVGRFATSIEFFGGCEVPVNRSWAVKAEYSLLFKSYTLTGTTYGYGDVDLRYNVQAPTIMAQYVIPGAGYFIKLGAGGGYHWGTVSVKTAVNGQETFYNANGIGGRAEIEGQTAFDSHLFGYISGTVGFEALGKVKTDAGGELANGSGPVSLNYATAGVRFGLMYFF